MRFSDGAVTFYSDGGTLWPNWPERAGIHRWSIRSIRVAEGTVKLPEDASGTDEWDPNKYSGSRVFGGLRNIRIFDMSGFDTSQVINMNYMFFRCQNLIDVRIVGCDMSNVKTMTGMAQAVCAALDSTERAGVLGSIAGDDTIFVATRADAVSASLVADIKKMMSRKNNDFLP